MAGFLDESRPLAQHGGWVGMTESHIHRQKLALLTGDILTFLVAFVVAMELRFGALQLSVFAYSTPPWEQMLIALPFMLAFWLATLSLGGLYQVDRNRVFWEFARLVRAIVIFMSIMLSLTFFHRSFSYSRGFAILFVPACLGLTFAGRILFRVIRARIEGHADYRRRVLLVANGPLAKHFATSSADTRNRIEVVGVLDDELAVGTEVAENLVVLGPTSELAAIAKTHDVQGVIVTNPQLARETQLNLYETCMGANLHWQVVPSAYELMLDRVELDVVAGVPVFGVRRSNIRGGNRIAKRGFDVIVGTLALIFVAPIMLIVAFLIKLSSKGPVLFTQERVGENGERFEFLKFRSMHTNNDDSIHREYAQKLIQEGAAASNDETGDLYKIKDDPRLIPIGAFIRKYSVDELPQLFNVIRGDMSLIGPRPPIPYEVEVYREWHKRRFEGPPGITGLWQVSGRNRLNFEQMVKLDIEYLENWSMGRDVRILWRTMGVVLFDKAY